jgi:hypothetical protein
LEVKKSRKISLCAIACKISLSFLTAWRASMTTLGARAAAIFIHNDAPRALVGCLDQLEAQLAPDDFRGADQGFERRAVVGGVKQPVELGVACVH